MSDNFINFYFELLILTFFIFRFYMDWFIFAFQVCLSNCLAEFYLTYFFYYIVELTGFLLVVDYSCVLSKEKY